MWKNEKFTAMQFFSSNQFIVQFFSKKLLSWNFYKIMVAVKFRYFHTCGNDGNSLSRSGAADKLLAFGLLIDLKDVLKWCRSLSEIRKGMKTI